MPEALYGGQAVLEGVMMKGPQCTAIAVRRPDTSIVVKEETCVSWTRRSPLLGLPVVRGVVSLVETLFLGINALIYSANQTAADESEQLGWKPYVVVAVVAAVGIFIIAPTALGGLGHRFTANPLLLNLLEGALRIFFLLAYIYAISFMKDIQRVLQYHGAEHKVINAFESGAELSPASVRPFPTLHPRCGTSFLLFVAVVSILLFTFFGWPDLWTRIITRLLAPLVAGLAYEVIRLAGAANPLVWLISLPGLGLQPLPPGSRTMRRWRWRSPPSVPLRWRETDMLEKLEAIARRYQELSEQLSDPDLLADQTEWRRVVKEHSRLEDLVATYRQLQAVEREIAGANELLQDKLEPELRELAETELADLQERAQDLRDQLRLMLLPRDPHDDKNVIVEIRGGAGGDEAGLFAAVFVPHVYALCGAPGLEKTEVLESKPDRGGRVPGSDIRHHRGRCLQPHEI